MLRRILLYLFNRSRRAAWQIKFGDVTLGSAVAEGAAGKVHTGQYAGHRVAIKVLKRPLNLELDPDGAEDFARECTLDSGFAGFLPFIAGVSARRRPCTRRVIGSYSVPMLLLC